MVDTVCAFVLCVLLGGIAVFELLLALGKPYGQYAWGGMHKVLPTTLRLASAASILLYVFFGFIVTDYMGWLDLSLNPAWMKGLAVYLSFGVLLNGISRSKNERLIMTPVVFIMAVCAWILLL